MLHRTNILCCREVSNGRAVRAYSDGGGQQASSRERESPLQLPHQVRGRLSAAPPPARLHRNSGPSSIRSQSPIYSGTRSVPPFHIWQVAVQAEEERVPEQVGDWTLLIYAQVSPRGEAGTAGGGRGLAAGWSGGAGGLFEEAKEGAGGEGRCGDDARGEGDDGGVADCQ